MIIELSLSNIKNACSEKNLDTDEVIRLLQDSGFSEKLKEDALNEKIYSWNVVSDLIEKYFIENSIDINIQKGTSSFLFNLAYFLPSYFIRLEAEGIIFISGLGRKKLLQVLSRPLISKFLLNGMLGCAKREIGMTFPARFTLLVLLSSTAHGFVVREEELDIISNLRKWVVSNRSEEDLLVDLAFQERADNLLKSYQKCDLSSKPLALFVSGQLRGFEIGLDSLLDNITDISNVDVFISTWKECGGTAVTWERLDRIFLPEAVDWIIENFKKSDLESISHKISNSFSIKDISSADKLRSIFSGAKSVKINIKDDKEFPYKEMFRSEKMYYHNCFWIKTLGPKYFSKYGKVVKIRPDIILNGGGYCFDDTSQCDGNSVFVENHGGWIFREWGFGIGDQIITGSSDVMMNVLDAHGVDKLSTKLKKLINLSGDDYSGHANCGFQAWLSGVDCKRSNIIHTGFANVNRLTLIDAKNLFEL